MNIEDELNDAIVNGDLDECKKLLNYIYEYNKIFPLCLACEYNNYKIVELLIKNGINVNEIDIYKQSALAYAVDMADLNIIKLLIKSGANINTSDINGIYPLHVAINRKNDEICDYLINEGAFINVVDKQGCTPLAMAVINDYVYMIYKLLKLGADPNIADCCGDTPLMKAIWSTTSDSHEEDQITSICNALIQAGANVNTKNDNGRTALFTAIYQNKTDVALCLISNGANFEIENTLKDNFTLLHYACYLGNYVLVKILLEKNCDPNAISTSGDTPLYVSIIKGYVDIVSLLIDYGASVNINYGSNKLLKNKCTVLQAAVYYLKDMVKFKKIVDKLIEAGVDLSDSNPISLINICLQYNKIEFAKYLLCNGSPINDSENCYVSCLYRAIIIKNYDFIQMCILAGVNLRKINPWLNNYIKNPNQNENNFNSINSYYVIKRSNNPIETETTLDKEDDKYSLNSLRLDETYLNKSSFTTEENDSNLNSNKIHSLIKHYYSNPLNLQELTRIQIRNTLHDKLKLKIQTKLPLPTKLKNYLLFKEFNC